VDARAGEWWLRQKPQRTKDGLRRQYCMCVW
jgi:hypothetical protein